MSLSISSTAKLNISKNNGSVYIKPPDWNIIPHKSMKTPSQDEMVIQIQELAVKRADAVTDEEYAVVNRQEEILSAQYLSSVSPDRKTLYNNVAKAAKSASQKGEKSDGVKTLIDYLDEKDGFISKLKNGKPYFLPGGGAVTPIYNSRGSYDLDLSIGGNTLMSSIQGAGRWTYTTTPAELEKRKEFNMIFDSAYNAAKAQKAASANSNTLDLKV